MAVGLETFVWCPGPVPADLPVTQVYGWLFDGCGRVLVQRTPEGHNLPGGSPEPFDVDVMATLSREAMEESQVVIDDAVLLGYELVQRTDGGPEALLRMVGRIAEFRPRERDPDGGRLLGRHMTSLSSACGLLEWGVSGTRQSSAAAAVAADRWRLPIASPTSEASDI